MVSILDVSMLEGSVNLSLDHLSQIKIDNMEKTTNGHAMESSPDQLTNTRSSPTEDSLYVNVGSPGSDITLPYSPRPEPVEARRASVDSFTPPLLEVIESGSDCFADRIAAVDVALDGVQRVKKIQNDVSRSAKLNRRYNDYTRPLAASETVFRPHYVAPMSW